MSLKDSWNRQMDRSKAPQRTLPNRETRIFPLLLLGLFMGATLAGCAGASSETRTVKADLVSDYHAVTEAFSLISSHKNDDQLKQEVKEAGGLIGQISCYYSKDCGLDGSLLLVIAGKESLERGDGRDCQDVELHLKSGSTYNRCMPTIPANLYLTAASLSGYFGSAATYASNVEACVDDSLLENVRQHFCGLMNAFGGLGAALTSVRVSATHDGIVQDFGLDPLKEYVMDVSLGIASTRGESRMWRAYLDMVDSEGVRLVNMDALRMGDDSSLTFQVSPTTNELLEDHLVTKQYVNPSTPPSFKVRFVEVTSGYDSEVEHEWTSLLLNTTASTATVLAGWTDARLRVICDSCPGEPKSDVALPPSDAQVAFAHERHFNVTLENSGHDLLIDFDCETTNASVPNNLCDLSQHLQAGQKTSWSFDLNETLVQKFNLKAYFSGPSWGTPQAQYGLAASTHWSTISIKATESTLSATCISGCSLSGG